MLHSGTYYEGVHLTESYGNAVTGNTFSKAGTGLILREGTICTTITKNVFEGCKVGVQVPSIPSCLIGNTYRNNKVNIK